MAHADRPVSKEDLLQHVWGYEADESNSNIVELAIRRLRKKMEDNPSVPNRLLTVRGVGYKFVPRFPPQRAGTTSGVQHRRATATFRSAPRSHSGEIYATNALEDEDEESELQSEQKQ
jgi:DNA-binding winged helix-turn-helix (wHTH) protein